MGWSSTKPKLNSPTSGGSGVGAYSNYYKAAPFVKSNSKNYQTAQSAISKALQDGGYPQEWLQPVLELVARESSFDATAKNSKSTARGLFQFLDGTRKLYGGNKVNWNDPYAQSVAGLKYIKDKYKDPVKALKHWDDKKWY